MNDLWYYVKILKWPIIAVCCVYAVIGYVVLHFIIKFW